MKHRLPDAQKAFLSRPFSTSRLLEADGSRGGHLAVLAVYLGLAGGSRAGGCRSEMVATAQVRSLEDTFINVSAGGGQRETPTSRTLLLARQVGRAKL